MSHFNTLKTTMGYIWTFVVRHLPPFMQRHELEAIFNFTPIDERIATSGQPTEMQLASLKGAGYDVVINLAPHMAENSLEDERATVTSLGMEYVHIPVDFKNPTNADFEKFCAAMESVQNRRVLVHCAANMRASCFTYRYRCQVLGEDRARAVRDMYRIWVPTGVWKKFIDAASVAPQKPRRTEPLGHISSAKPA